MSTNSSDAGSVTAPAVNAGSIQEPGRAAKALPSVTSLAPPADPRPQVFSYTTTGGVTITRTSEPVALDEVLEGPRRALDRRRGAIFTSNYEYPDRYRRFDIAFVDPCLVLEGCGRSFRILSLNNRGAVLLPLIADTLRTEAHVESLTVHGDRITGSVRTPEGAFPEEQRSRQPSIFSVLRAFHRLFGSDCDPHLGLYGAFGYDLVFQFEPIPLRHSRVGEPDLVLYLPDELLVADRPRESSYRVRYDFSANGASTRGLPRSGADIEPAPAREGADGAASAGAAPSCDHAPGEYARVVETVREGCRQGDFFEVVPGQVFAAPCAALPSVLFERLCHKNPSPYGFLINMGAEQLVGASPEMFVRVDGKRVETCPISGTITRGADPIADAHQIRELLNSVKDEAELTMCTDVDRNDKSRICVPGSVRVLGRRQVELYSRVIHTVDHVEGTLLPEFDALDAFLSHTWAVTVTGAPKRAAVECIERLEKSPRRFYGGAVGFFTFNGNINTGITIRTIRLSGGTAEVRAGATLLYDSVPDDEERETRQKASAMLEVIREASIAAHTHIDEGNAVQPGAPAEAKVRVLLVDHEDSFVHTLANYLRQAGAEVVTLRGPISDAMLETQNPGLVVLSPGPGRPEDYGVPALVRLCAEKRIPAFGVCLGLQGMVQAFGGELGVLPTPVHGKPSMISHTSHPLFQGLPDCFQAGRYHSLYAIPGSFPGELEQIAESDDGVIMAVAHRTLPLAAVQFHPESILSQGGQHGLQIIRNALSILSRPLSGGARL